MNDTKICNCCKKELPATTEYFHRDSTLKSGIRGICKECCCKNRKEYSKTNREYEHNYGKQYREKNKEELKIKLSKWKNENKDKIADEWQRYYEANKARLAKNRKIYWSNNKERYKVSIQRRKARKRELVSNLTIAQWENIKQIFDNKCAYCGRELKLYQEHFIPLSKGGEFTINNIIPSCQSCNSSKHDRLFNEWYPRYKYYNKKREEKILSHLHYKNNIQQLTLLQNVL
jgi:hypothetical protein